MKTIRTSAKNMDEYIAGFPVKTQSVLKIMRATIRNSAPGAKETISYAIPTFVLRKNLVHFAAFKNHIGFYPTPSAIREFSGELAAYKGAKGSVQFPLDSPLPLRLISKIVKFRVKENLEKTKRKEKKKKK